MTAENNCERFGTFGPDRSAGKYTHFVDLYDHKVTVRHSTLASQEAVWIQTTLMPQQADMLRSVGHNPAEFAASAHLCRDMAYEVMNALSHFLYETKDEQGECGPPIVMANMTPRQGGPTHPRRRFRNRFRSWRRRRRNANRGRRGYHGQKFMGYGSTEGTDQY